MKITTEHATSSYGIPVILDDNNSPLDYGPGLRAVRARLSLSVEEVAAAVGKSRRTIEDWCQGRSNIPASALNVLKKLLESQESDA
jgi:DNA-binding transcriptional regulator YiaG